MSPAERRGVLFRRCVVPSYHPLNQLTDFRRGVLSDSNSDGVPDTVATASRSQAWDFDALGNWDSVTTDGNVQTRSHNRQNQITAISGQTTPTYDNNGNTTTDQSGKTLVYDAWNRLVAYKDGTTTLVSYQYDPLFRRVVENPGTAVDLYFSTEWQVLEEQQAGQAKSQHVWSPVYIDALVLRDRDADGNGTLEERLYVQQDSNFNVTALIDTRGTVVERYVYDPYGSVGMRDPGWAFRASSSFAYRYLHQGGRYESTSGLYYFRNREYSAALGRWVQTDRLGYIDGTNLYQYLHNAPMRSNDPSGLFSPGDHAAMTRDAVVAWAEKKGVAGGELACIQQVVIRSNLEQDRVNFNRMEVHFNRPFRQADNDAESDNGAWIGRALDGQRWKVRYKEYIQGELDNFWSHGAEDCTGQLEILGRVSHSWQDFFSHAVRVDQGGTTYRINNPAAGQRFRRLGSVNSWWPGFSAFADADRRTGDPENTTGFIPSSYDTIWNGEHPRAFEPTNGAEYQARRQAAENWVGKKLAELLDAWYHNCRGCCETRRG